jgi:hypothetical protein
MKRIFLLLMVASTLPSCQYFNSSPDLQKNLQVSLVQIQDSSGCINAKMNVLYFDKQNPAAEKIRLAVAKTQIGNYVSDMQFDDVAQIQPKFEAFIKKFIADGEQCQKELPDAASCCYQLLEELKVSYNNMNILSITDAQWEYTGGAHGNFWELHHVFDTETGKLLTLQDFFNDVNALAHLAEDIFYQQYELDKNIPLGEQGFYFGEGLAEGEFYLTKNFALHDTHIEFTYNPYEVSSYATGIVSIAIKYEQIRDLLKVNL